MVADCFVAGAARCEMNTTTLEPNLPQQQGEMTVVVHCAERTLRLTVDRDISIRQALDATDLRVRAACGGLGGCGACLIQVVRGDFNPPTLAERQKLLPEELDNNFRLACQLWPRGNGELNLENPAPRSCWKSLDTAQLYRAAPNSEITANVYGVAVDLGTTHIRLSLWNRQTGRRIGSRYSVNPQVAHGADVLTRLDAERLAAPENRRIGQQARHAIIDGVRDILSRDMGEITPILNQLGKVAIVGNTAMLALLCGSDGAALFEPENWQHPVACTPGDAEAWRAGWHTPHADIEAIQPLAGFIGSDLIADVLATGIAEQPRPALLADFGTNTEVALWDGNRLWATSVPGGPAFEGTGIRNGMPADSGAICKVSRSQGAWQLQTLTTDAPRGFCASGFIDAIALLLEEKQLKPSGRFADPQPENGYRLDLGNPKTAIFAADIDIFQRAKASTAAAMAQLLNLAGLTVGDLAMLWICGSFGRHLNPDSAFRVGLLPAMAAHRVKLFANASLAGCETLLLNPGSRQRVDAMVAHTRIVNLGGMTTYDDLFIENLRLQAMSVSS